MLNELISIRGTVYQLLKNIPETRDDDNKLIMEVWKTQAPDLLDMNASELLSNLLNKKFCSVASITRARRKIQEDGEFRGLAYEGRHKEKIKVKEYFKEQKS